MVQTALGGRAAPGPAATTPSASANAGPALPRPHHTRREAGEKLPLLPVVLQMLEVLMVAMVVARALAGEIVPTLAAAMRTASGRVGRGREHGGGQSQCGDGGCDYLGRGGHG